MKNKTRIPAIDQDLRNHPRELPADVIVHTKLVVTRRSGEAIMKQMKSGKPTEALRNLMGGRD